MNDVKLLNDRNTTIIQILDYLISKVIIDFAGISMFNV